MSAHRALIETDAGTYLHPREFSSSEYHARFAAETLCIMGTPKQGTRIVKVALMRGDVLVDVFDGVMWANDRHDD